MFLHEIAPFQQPTGVSASHWTDQAELARLSHVTRSQINSQSCGYQDKLRLRQQATAPAVMEVKSGN